MSAKNYDNAILDGGVLKDFHLPGWQPLVYDVYVNADGSWTLVDDHQEPTNCSTWVNDECKCMLAPEEQ